MWFQKSRVRAPSIAHLSEAHKLTTIEALLLGILQGFTEFLPVSSSGHLKLAQYLFGFKDLERYLLFDLICHVGTISAILAYYFRPILLILRFDRVRTLQVVIATLPLFPFVLLLKPLKEIMNHPEYLGYFFFITAGLLYLGVLLGRTRPPFRDRETPYRDALYIGLFQIMALLPGVSRSGSTISGARILGWSAQEAILFSFLLAIPAILGSATLISLDAFLHPELLANNGISLLQYIAGFVTSFGVGLFALSLLNRMAVKNQWMVFVWYCAFVGALTLMFVK